MTGRRGGRELPKGLSQLLRRDLIGLKLKVISSPCHNYRGIGGIVIDETKNMLILDTEDGIKKVPKKAASFLIKLEGFPPIRVEGWRLLGRPEEKIGR
ncbi:ribonuclease P protein subunit [Candidatus Bathyarchaeota archaeon]|nr:ribonuclease P protein subunit [Candidatus Bathyarchaeota archaeon]MBS7627771.1 ribonuclease P protein subunit [Candidatus Bathyarchaeota archaeon]